MNALWCSHCRHHLTAHRLVSGTPMCDDCGGQGAVHKYRERTGWPQLDWRSAGFFVLLAALLWVGGWLWG